MTKIEVSQTGNRKIHLQCRLNSNNPGDDSLLDMIEHISDENPGISISDIVREALKSLYQALTGESGEIEDLTTGRITKEMMDILKEIKSIQHSIKSGDAYTEELDVEIEEKINDVEYNIKGTYKLGSIDLSSEMEDDEDWD